jgi:hypothetical protein
MHKIVRVGPLRLSSPRIDPAILPHVRRSQLAVNRPPVPRWFSPLYGLPQGSRYHVCKNSKNRYNLGRPGSLSV